MKQMINECSVLRGMLAETRAKINLTPKESSISTMETDLIEILDRLDELEKCCDDPKYFYGTS